MAASVSQIKSTGTQNGSPYYVVTAALLNVLKSGVDKVKTAYNSPNGVVTSYKLGSITNLNGVDSTGLTTLLNDGRSRIQDCLTEAEYTSIFGSADLYITQAVDKAASIPATSVASATRLPFIEDYLTYAKKASDDVARIIAFFLTNIPESTVTPETPASSSTTTLVYAARVTMQVLTDYAKQVLQVQVYQPWFSSIQALATPIFDAYKEVTTDMISKQGAAWELQKVNAIIKDLQLVIAEIDKKIAECKSKIAEVQAALAASAPPTSTGNITPEGKDISTMTLEELKSYLTELESQKTTLEEKKVAV